MSVRIVDGVPWVGDRSFPWASRVDYSDVGDFHERRFHLTFENGWTLSVVFGSHTYSDNRRVFYGESFAEEVKTVEVALWDRERNWVEWPSGDTVMGDVSEDELLALIADSMARPS